MKNFREQLTLLIWWFSFLFLLFIALLLYGNSSLFILINSKGQESFDALFMAATKIGEAWILVPTCIFIIWRSKIIGLIASLTLVCSSLTTQFLKKVVFVDFVRPSAFYINSDYKVRTIEGLELHSLFSFPSGHTTGATALFVFLALNYTNSKSRFLLLLLPIFVAYSRIYLGQHFPLDVLVGAFIGTFYAILFTFLFHSKMQNAKASSS
jgi:membrane-associated phospholipid phosphatase